MGYGRTMSDTVRVLLFATLRELAGSPMVDLTLPVESTVSGCWDELCSKLPQLSVQRQVIRPALNRSYVGWDTRVSPGDELAFIPPVSGGWGG